MDLFGHVFRRYTYLSKRTTEYLSKDFRPNFIVLREIYSYPSHRKLVNWGRGKAVFCPLCEVAFYE